MVLKKRLKDEFKTDLEIANIKYPSVVECISEQLETKHYVNDLTYECILYMQMIFRVDNPYFYFNEVW